TELSHFTYAIHGAHIVRDAFWTFTASVTVDFAAPFAIDNKLELMSSTGQLDRGRPFPSLVHSHWRCIGLPFVECPCEENFLGIGCVAGELCCFGRSGSRG